MTDQQAVTVAQEKLPTRCDGKEQYAFEAWAAALRYDMSEHPLHYLFLNERTAAARDGWAAGLKYASDIAARLASVSSASAEGFVLVPRKLTDDMHEAVVKLDFTSTHDPLWPEYWAAMLDAAPKSEPVPATNQAGEVATAVELLERYAQFIRDDVKADDLERHPYLPLIEQTIAALATQPATSQEREGLPTDRYGETVLDRIRDHAENGVMPPEFRDDLRTILGLALAATQSATSQEGEACPKCDDSGYQDFASGGVWTGEGISTQREICDCACGDDVSRSIADEALAATPTPPTLNSWANTPEAEHGRILLMAEIELHLKSCRIFLTSREKMHPVGVDIHDELLAKVTAAIEATGSEKANG